MRLELTGRHVDITPALRQMVDRKLVRLDRMLNDSALSAQVVLALEKHGHRADLTLHARGEIFLHSVGSAAPTWNIALSQAVEKLVQQAQKIKGKWQERKRRGRKAGANAGEPQGVMAVRAVRAQAERVRLRMPRIVRAPRQAIRALSLADAAREVEANGEGIVVFRDAETAGISVLYRRSTGELTLVQTET